MNSTPPEVFSTISSFLDGYNILRLLLSGDKMLIRMMTERGGVKWFELCFLAPHHVRWPSLLASFRQLTHLKLCASSALEYVPLYGAEIEKLAPTIETLIFNFFNATSCFYHLHAPSTPGSPILKDIKHIFPRLKHWKLPNGHPNPAITIFSELPPTLTSLRITMHAIPYESISLIPRSVTKLQIRLVNELSRDLLKTLDPSFPPYLQYLSVSEAPSFAFIKYIPSTVEHLIASGSEDTYELGEEDLALHYLPPTLKKLALYTTSEPLWSPSIFRSLPRGLDSLDFVTEEFANVRSPYEILECLKSLPQFLTNFCTFPGTIVLDNRETMEVCGEEIKKLFANVKFASQPYQLIWDRLKWLPSNLTSASVFVDRLKSLSLPDSVISLIISLPATGSFSHSLPTNFKFPSDLKVLKALRRPFSMDNMQFESLKQLPNLTHLINVSLQAESLQYLPNTLKKLQLRIGPLSKGDIQCNTTNASIKHLLQLQELSISFTDPPNGDTVFSNLPPSLKSLSILGQGDIDANVLKKFNPSTTPLLTSLTLRVCNLGDHHLDNLPQRLNSLHIAGTAGKEELTKHAFLKLPSSITSVHIPCPINPRNHQIDFSTLPYLRDLHLIRDQLGGSPVYNFSTVTDAQKTKFGNEFGSLHAPLR